MSALREDNHRLSPVGGGAARRSSRAGSQDARSRAPARAARRRTAADATSAACRSCRSRSSRRRRAGDRPARVVGVADDGTEIIYEGDAALGKAATLDDDTDARRATRRADRAAPRASATSRAPRRASTRARARRARRVARRDARSRRVRADYRAAVELVKAGKHDDAIAALRAFLAALPAPRLRRQRAVLARRGVLRAEGLPACARRVPRYDRDLSARKQGARRAAQGGILLPGARPGRQGARRAGASREPLSEDRARRARREAIGDAVKKHRCSRSLLVPRAARRAGAASSAAHDAPRRADQRSIPARRDRAGTAAAAAAAAGRAAQQAERRSSSAPTARSTYGRRSRRPTPSGYYYAGDGSEPASTTSRPRSTRGPMPELHVVRTRRHAVGHLLATTSTIRGSGRRSGRTTRRSRTRTGSIPATSCACCRAACSRSSDARAPRSPSRRRRSRRRQPAAAGAAARGRPQADRVRREERPRQVDHDRRRGRREGAARHRRLGLPELSGGQAAAGRPALLDLRARQRGEANGKEVGAYVHILGTRRGRRASSRTSARAA